MDRFIVTVPVTHPSAPEIGSPHSIHFGKAAMIPLFLAFVTVVGLPIIAADFPDPYDSETRGKLMSAEESARSFKMPPGFKITVFANEPDVRQPIAMTFDPRGRLWVAENYTYAESKVRFATNLLDRLLIFEDIDNDGHFDKRTVFYDRARILTSVAVGMGGIFLMCPPRLLFIADRNQDDVPDAEPEVLLDGFDGFNLTPGGHHTFANGLKWGPDGWLWGRVGPSTASRVGKSGAPESERLLMNGCIWRYQPQRRVFEVVCHGTTNPWGLDWNEVGEPFFINTVTGHLWHAIPGAHFRCNPGTDVLPNIYGFIDQHADHYHYDTGAGWTHSRAAEDGSSFAKTSDALGGGHAHSGLMIYQGDNWPPQYRGKLYTANLHGRRINSDRLERQGSGYVGRHERDLLSVGDVWFRGIDLLQGPDGGVFIADWSDWGECHDSDGVHRNSGRIYKVTYGDPPKPTGRELTKQSDQTLVALLFGTNQWVAQQARQVLGDRGLDPGKRPMLSEEILRAFTNQRETAQKLHALWALVAIGAAPCNWLLEQTHDPDEHIRSWAVRLVTDAIAAEVESNSRNPQNPSQPETLPLVASAAERFAELARSDPSALVRLYLASALQKVPLNSRPELALALLRHDEDVGDHNMGLMLWFGIEPLVSAKPLGGAELAIESRHGIVRQYVTRRLAADVERNPAGLEQLLAAVVNSKDGFTAQIRDILNGMTEALRGWRKASPPQNWHIFAARAVTNSEVKIKDQVRELSLLFGDPEMLASIRKTLADTQASAAARKNALRILLDRRTDGLAALLKQVAKEDDLGIDATLGLLQLGDLEAPGLALSHYDLSNQSNRTQILGAMVTRPIAANVLLNAVAEGRIPRTDVTPFHARQIASLNDVGLTKRLSEVWGSVRINDAEKRASMDRFRSELSAPQLQSANLSNGRRVFNQACASCHKLYGEGGAVGPDLTGSGRTQLDYLLENVVDPSAVMSVEYRMSIIRSKNGEVFNGLVREKTERTVTIQSQTESITIEASDIVSIEESRLSLMPEGMLESIGADDRRDLIGYLMHSQQVPLPR